MAKKIQDITETLRANGWQARSSSSEAKNDDRRPSKTVIAGLFAYFHVLFPNKWVSAVPDDKTEAVAIVAWQKQLEGISENEIVQGIKRLSQRPGDTFRWPPSAPEFRRLCRRHREPYERTEFQAKPLPAKTASLETARANVAKIKADLSRTHNGCTQDEQ